MIVDLIRLLRTVNVSIISVDRREVVNGWTEKAEQLTGYSPEEVIGRDFTSHFIHAEFGDSLRVLRQETFMGKATMNHELPLFTRTQRDCVTRKGS